MNETMLSNKYLITIESLQKNRSHVRCADIANKLNFSRASVNYAIGKLKSLGYVTQEKYKLVSLTPEGKLRVKQIIDKRALLQKYLIQTLGIDNKTALSQAVTMELCIDDDVVLEKIKKVFNS